LLLLGRWATTNCRRRAKSKNHVRTSIILRNLHDFIFYFNDSINRKLNEIKIIIFESGF